MTLSLCRWYVRLRRLVQVVTLLTLCLLPWANSHGWHVISGNFFALDLAGLPFADPLSALQVWAAGLTPGPRLWLGGLCTLGVALILGRVFCSWFCPYGLLSEWLYVLYVRQSSSRRSRIPAIAPRLALACLGLAGTALLGFPLLNSLSLPGELSLLPLTVQSAAASPVFESGVLWSATSGTLALLAAAMLLDILSRRRFWCRYLCPQSVCLGLAALCWPKGLRVLWNPRRCTCGKESPPCNAACSLGLQPRHTRGPSRLECTHCGDCVASCARCGGALRLGFGGRRHEA